MTEHSGCLRKIRCNPDPSPSVPASTTEKKDGIVDRHGTYWNAPGGSNPAANSEVLRLHALGYDSAQRVHLLLLRS